MSDYRVNQNKVYKAEGNDFVTNWVSCDVPFGPVEPEWKKQKIPYAVWQQMKAFCSWSQHKMKSEALVLLFFDDERGWVPWAPPQETWGMSVDSDPKDPEYAKQRAELPELMLGSLHHHCTTSAFASGTDDSDECKKDGIHFTLGHMESKVLDIDARFLQNERKTEVSARNWIEFPEWVEVLPYEDLKDAIKDRMLEANDSVDFPEFWKENITKGVRTWGRNQNTYNYGGYGQNGVKKKQKSTPAKQESNSLTSFTSTEATDFLDLTGIGLYDLGFILCNNLPDDFNTEFLYVANNLEALMDNCGVTRIQLMNAVEEGTQIPITEFALDYEGTM